MSSGGGGGQSGITRYDWNPDIARYWTEVVLPGAQAEAGKPYQSYGNGASRVAGFNNDQYTAQQRVRDMANAGGPTDTLQGRWAAGNIAGGGALEANPYGGMSNPYFSSVLQSGLGDITNAYKQGTSADTTRLFNLSGAFGGSAHQNAIANNENALAKQLSQYTQGMQNQQYDRSAGLYESGLGRQMQAIPLAFQGQQLSSDLINQLGGVGQQGQQLTQRQMDDQLAQWQEAMNWGRNNVDWLTNVLGRAQGSTGTTSTTAGYQPVNYGSAALGAGLLANGLMR